MSQQPRKKIQTDRVRHARQVLAGESVRPAPDPWAATEGGIPLTPLQRNFLIAMTLLLLAGAALAFTDYLLLATIPFFLLALGLILARFLF